MFLIHLKFCSCKVYQNFLGTTRLLCISNAARMTLLSIMVCEIQLFKFEVSAQSGILEQFWLCPVLTNLTTQSVNMV